MTVEAHKQLDLADAEFKSIKKIFDLKTSGSDYEARKKTASAFRKTIEDVFATVTNANNIIQGKILISFSSIKVNRYLIYVQYKISGDKCTIYCQKTYRKRRKST